MLILTFSFPFGLVIKKACLRGGMNPSDFSAHSLRKGGTTGAFIAGADRMMVKAQGDWVSDAYLRYVTFSLDQRLSVPQAIIEAMRSPQFYDRCASLSLATAAAIYE